MAKAAQRSRGGGGGAVREPSFIAAGWLEHCDVTGRDIIIINLTTQSSTLSNLDAGPAKNPGRLSGNRRLGSIGRTK